jgi:hypothetical protein
MFWGEEILDEHPDDFALPGATSHVDITLYIKSLFNTTARLLAICLCIFTEGPVADEMFAVACEHYSAFWILRTHFSIEETNFFQLTQKAHSCLHGCLLAGVMNPRRTWCFKFEDCVG